MMAKMIDLSPTKSPVLRAVDAIHGFVPLVAGLFYLVSAAILAFRRGRQEEIRRRPSRAVILWLALAILSTYVFETAVLFHLTYPGRAMRSLDEIMYSFSSSFSWFILLLDINWFHKSQALWYPLGGCSAIYTIAEALLLTFRSRSVAPVKILNVVRIFRLVTLILLVGFVAISQAIAIRCRPIDEERVSLLPDDRTRNPDDIYPFYGSIYRNPIRHPQGRDNEGGLEYFTRRITFLAPFFWPSSQPYLRYFGIWLCLLVDRVLLVLVPLQLGKVTDALTRKGTFSNGDIAIAIFICVLKFSKSSAIAQKYLWVAIENHSYSMLSKAVFDKATTLACELNRKRNPERIWESVNRGISGRHVFRAILSHIIPTAVDLLVGVCVLYYIYGAYMALIFATVVALSIWSSREIHRKLQYKQRRFIDDMNREQHILRDWTSSWQTALYFNRIPYEETRYSLAVRDHLNSSSRLSLWFCVDSVLQSAITIPGLMGGGLLAGFQVSWGVKSLGSFIMLLMYLTRLGLHLQIFMRGVRDVLLGLTDVDELFKLFGRTSNAPNHIASASLRCGQGAIEFNDVHFAYRGQKRALKGVSFHVQAGQTVALAGATGSGKSTVLGLLLRLYDPLQGNIRIDGQDVRHVTLESLRSSIGIVPQDPVLFHDTIMNNVMYGNFSATEGQVYDACKAVALHDRFVSLEDGYHTTIGDGGVRLSGGELQRLAVARVIVQNPKIILLDGATSSVDSSTEALIQRNFKRLWRGKTILITSHRLSMVSKADNIIVLRHGRLVEQGSHSSLLRTNSYYRRLLSRQIKVKLPPVVIKSTGQAQEQRATEDFAKGKIVTQEMGDLIEMDDSRSVTETGPILAVSKMRRMRSYKKAGSPDANENSRSINNEPWRKSPLKPDAPVFVPLSQRAALRNADESDAKNCLADIENMRETSGTTIGNDSSAGYSVENGKNPKRKRRDGSRQASSALRQSSNEVILAYPKKARKRMGSKRLPVLRRERTESEPIGIGLITETYEQ